LIKKRRYFKIYVPCLYLTENSTECKNCEDRYRCKRQGDDLSAIPTTFEDPYFEDPYKKYIMGD